MTTTSQMTARPMPDRNAFEDLVAMPYQNQNHSNNSSYRQSMCDQLPYPSTTNPNDASRLSTSSISSSNSTMVKGLTTNTTAPNFNEHDNTATTVTVVVNLPPPLSPKLICPPTPVRIHPIFRTGNEDNIDNAYAAEEPFEYSISTSLYPEPGLLPKHTRQKLERSNSLIATKIIATCSPQLLLQHVPTNPIGEDRGNIQNRDPTSSPLPLLQSTGTTINDGPLDHDHLWNTMNGSVPTSANAEYAIAGRGKFHQNPDLSFDNLYPPSISLASVAMDAAVVANGEPPPAPPKKPQQGASISLTNNFDVISTLGSGTFADVYKVISKADHRAYAIKRNRRQFRSKRDREVLLSEVRCMQRLQSQMTLVGQHLPQHDSSRYSMYLLFFYRAWQEDGHILCQTELCCRDTCREMIDTIQYWNPSISSIKFPTISSSWMTRLQQYSYDNATALPSDSSTTGAATGWDNQNRKISCGDGKVVPEHVIWKICHDICAGLSFIHSSKVGLVHNDIKPSNILFVKHPQYGAICKIGDFGMARDIGSSEDGQEGDQKYMALEMLEYGTSYPSTDIFSLGLTLYEMASHIHVTIPPDGHRWHELRSGNMNMNDFPNDRTTDLTNVIRRMMNSGPTSRPSADDILSISMVHDAGNTQNNFLRDYINDIEGYELREEEWMSHGARRNNNNNSNNNNGENRNNMNYVLPPDEQTPRNASTRPLYSPPMIDDAKIPTLPFAIVPTPSATATARTVLR